MVRRNVSKTKEAFGAWFFPLWLFLAILPVSRALAEGPEARPTPDAAALQTHWTTLGGMQYLLEGKALSGPELDRTLHTLEDQRVDALLAKSESDETLGFIGLGGSLALSALSLFFPNTHIHVIGLDISAPFLPVAVPGAALGLAGGLLEMEAGTAKYAAVQRYNRLVRPSGPLSWNLSPRNDGWVLQAVCGF
jgi:hypothetical protein